jgi:hypothetical protein
VIQDAIDFTKQIDQRYVWIDGLCIVQDDDEMKASIIGKMNLVYRHAFLTLFAATGDDANSGLAGFRPKSRPSTQAIATIAPDLALAYPLSHASLEKSVWASRGWT